jgi:hypothetical protein
MVSRERPHPVPRRRRTDADLEALLPVATFTGFAAATEVVVFRDRVVIETVDRSNLRRQQQTFPLDEMAVPEIVRARGTLASVHFVSGSGQATEIVFGSLAAAREARDAVLRVIQEYRLDVPPERGPRKAG